MTDSLLQDLPAELKQEMRIYFFGNRRLSISPLLCPLVSLLSDANVLPKCCLPSCHLLLPAVFRAEFVDSLGGRRDRSRGHHMNPSCVSLNVTPPISDRSPLQVGFDSLGIFMLHKFTAGIFISRSNSEGERTRGIITRWNTFNRGLTAALSHSYGLWTNSGTAF